MSWGSPKKTEHRETGTIGFSLSAPTLWIRGLGFGGCLPKHIHPRNSWCGAEATPHSRRGLATQQEGMIPILHPAAWSSRVFSMTDFPGFIFLKLCLRRKPGPRLWVNMTSDGCQGAPASGMTARLSRGEMDGRQSRSAMTTTPAQRDGVRSPQRLLQQQKRQTAPWQP